VTDDLAARAACLGIEPTWTGFDGIDRAVTAGTLAVLVDALGGSGANSRPPPTIEAVATAEHPCFVPAKLADARVWGLTTQIGALASGRNAGMGDFADLANLCVIAAREGADFVGVNPVHALFWNDPGRASPFFPSNRSFLNPLYLALEWVPGFAGLSQVEAGEAARLREGQLVDHVAVRRLKDGSLRRLYASAPAEPGFDAFVADRGDALRAHAAFEALGGHMTAEGLGASPSTWPEHYRTFASPAVAAFMDTHADDVRYHMWLQYQADRQLARVQRTAREAGMRTGLYLDLAVGAAPDGSAAWHDPALTVPGLSVGAPPDPFSAAGQDWGLAPLSPVSIAADEGQAFAAMLGDVVRHAGAVRIDHAMSLARLWLIPRGRGATEGAYVRYPLHVLMDRLAEVSHMNETLVIGEDLGNVPPAFRGLMAARSLHAYKVFHFERDGADFAEPATWPRGVLACLGTHDLPTFAGWWHGDDMILRHGIGHLDTDTLEREQRDRAADRARLTRRLGPTVDVAELSVRLHAHIAASPCRLAVLQIEDALGVREQVNLPGTVDKYPNWRRRLPVDVERLADHQGFAAHTAAMRAERPR